MLALNTVCSFNTCILLRVSSLSCLLLESKSQNLPVLLAMSSYYSLWSLSQRYECQELKWHNALAIGTAAPGLSQVSCLNRKQRWQQPWQLSGSYFHQECRTRACPAWIRDALVCPAGCHPAPAMFAVLTVFVVSWKNPASVLFVPFLQGLFCLPSLCFHSRAPGMGRVISVIHLSKACLLPWIPLSKWLKRSLSCFWNDPWPLNFRVNHRSWEGADSCGKGRSLFPGRTDCPLRVRTLTS